MDFEQKENGQIGDEELADRVVALGVGEHYPLKSSLYWLRESYGEYNLTFDEHAFVKNWQVAGALMQRCVDRDLDFITAKTRTGGHGIAVTYDIGDDQNQTRGQAFHISLTRAITEACVKALEAK